MWAPPGDIQPQTKSDLLRLLLLYRFGGVSGGPGLGSILHTVVLRLFL